MVMIEDNDRRIIEKLDFFYNERVEIHIVKKDREFWNGILLTPKKEDRSVWIFKERKIGEVLLFVSDIFEVSEFREVRG